LEKATSDIKSQDKEKDKLERELAELSNSKTSNNNSGSDMSPE
jgi:hypothetical protein